MPVKSGTLVDYHGSNKSMYGQYVVHSQHSKELDTYALIPYKGKFGDPYLYNVRRQSFTVIY